MFPAAAPQKCVMLLLRHGATAANLAQPPILQGRGINWGLAPAGVEQAERTARLLAPIQLDRIYCSPLIRAQETALAISAALPLEKSPSIETVDALTEVHAGRWEGRCWPEIKSAEPEAYASHHQDASLFGYPEGESLTDVNRRVMPIFLRLLTENLGRRILVVAHNIVNRAFLCEVLGLPLIHYRNIAQDNCGINIIEHSDKGTILRSLNVVTHLHD